MLDLNLGEYGFCKPYHVDKRPSIADIFPEKTRCGIYLLSFSDGAYYVGRTKNVVARYASHAKNHPDISAIAFKPLAEKDQDAFERTMIHLLEGKGHRLRNQLEASIPYGDSDLDTLIAKENQVIWKEGKQIDYSKTREHVQSIVFEQLDQFRVFEKHPQSQSISNALCEYVHNCLIAPELTEVSFWSLSCMPSTQSGYSKKDLCRINIGRCEVLTIGEKLEWFKDAAIGQEIFAAFHVARTPLEDDQGYVDGDRLSREIPGLIPFDHAYRFGGQDQWAFFVQSIDGIRTAIRHPAMRQAIRLFNLRSMQKRANMYARYHCAALANRLFDRP